MVLDFEELRERNTCVIESNPEHGRGQSEDEDGQTGDEHGALSVVAVVDEVSNTELDGGDHRCQRSKGERQEKHGRHDQRSDGPARCLGKDLWQSKEGDGRRAARDRCQRIGLHGKDG